MGSNLDHKALIFAERHGIIDYKVENGKMVWEESYPNEGRFIHTLDLETLEEKTKQF